MPQRKAILLFAVAAATLVISVTAAVGPLTLFWTNHTRVERNLVEHQLESLRTVQGLLVDAETGERAYVLTGQDVFLQPYHVAMSQLPSALKTLRQAYEGDLPEEVAQMEALIEQGNRKLHHLNTVVRLRADEGYEQAKAEVASGRGKALMDDFRDKAATLIADETQEVASLDDELQTHIRWAVAISVATSLFTLALGRFIFATLRRAVVRQTESAERQAESAAAAMKVSNELKLSLESLEHRNQEIGLLAEMARLMQTELTQEEILKLANAYCQRLLSGSKGDFFLYRNSADALSLAACWGRDDAVEGSLINPTDCWAIRRGRHHVVEHEHDLRCAHYDSNASSAGRRSVHWCLPLMAYGEVMGLLHIEQDQHHEMGATLQFAEAIAEQTALALANGRMRQVLQTQSIRDPLTALYNRRFMEETLERELARTRRGGSALSVIMLDLDHFKSLNDRYGHSAGDNVLKAVSSLLRESLRASDIACRFGGEELIIILPDCPLDGALARAEAIRAALQAMSVVEVGQSLSVTASFGVASTERCGTDQSALLKAADSALYDAKRAGRNRVAPSLASRPDAALRLITGEEKS